MVNHYNALSGATLRGGNEMEKEEHKCSDGVLISRKSANTSHVVAERGARSRGTGFGSSTDIFLVCCFKERLESKCGRRWKDKS